MLKLFSATIFISALLLFWIQPMFGKMILPYLGGGPSVWNTCMVFYQALLLLGYIYAHFSIKILGIKKQSILHIILMILPFFVLPIKISSSWEPPVIDNPIPSVLALMLMSIGLPFFILSASSPMLQRWFSNINHPLAKDPYFLYVASNLGSMLSLFSYPFLIEPNLRISYQSYVWAFLYFIFVIFMIACAVKLNKNLASGVDDLIVDSSETISVLERLKWVAFAFIPSSLMLGVTSYISTDISPIPLFWIVPLAIYLLTFILTFSNKQFFKHSLMVKIMPFMISALLLYTVSRNNYDIWFAFLLHLINFFVCAMVCHGELSRNRPPLKFLTEFYIWISVGGFLGGVFNALIAPVVFKEIIEYPLIIILACILKPVLDKTKESTFNLKNEILYFIGPGLGVLFLDYVARDLGLYKIDSYVGYFVYGIPLIFCIKAVNYPLRFGLSVGSIIIAFSFISHLNSKDTLLFCERNFFGIHRVSIDSNKKFLNLFQDTTLHGSQSLDQRDTCYPLSYYHPSGPIGQMFNAFYNDQSKKRVAAVGLGTGSLACYGKEDQEWTFFDIDPTIVALNQSGSSFTYLVNSYADTKVIFGDARLSLNRIMAAEFDFIILDAFSSDAIPLHLITQEALDLYLSRLAVGGIIAFHTSNRHLNLPMVLASLALNRNLQAIIEQDNLTNYPGKTSSEWVLIARRKEDFGKLNQDNRWKPLYADLNAPVWTDDYSNIFSIIKDFRF